MERGNKRTPAQFWGMGTAIGLCAAVGVALGALLNNIALWLAIGAGLGVVLGAITEANKKKKQ